MAAADQLQRLFLTVLLQFFPVHVQARQIIQEQGRPLLKSFNGLGWGTAKQPYCRGFTPQEFQALDFSRMDLSDYYADIEARAQSDIQIDMEDRIDAYLQTVNP